MAALQVVCTGHAACALSGTIRRYSFGSRNAEEQGVNALLTFKRAGPSPGTKKTNTFKGQGRPPRVVRATLPLGGPQHATSCLPSRKRSNHRQSSA
jgi:hypothetical protein